MKKNFNTILVSGLALFSMFFGAGNLIFPPTLGMKAGSSFIPATLGFLISSVGIVLLAVLASTKAGGSIDSIAGKVNKKFSVVFGTLVILAIGPVLAIPRTAATTFEIIQGTTLPGLNPIVSSIVFFGIVLFFVLNPTNIIDSLGKFLTPVLLIVLTMIVVKGFITPLGTIVNTGATGVFAKSFEEGYQTMDALAALVFTTVVIKGFESKGIKDKKELISSTIFASLIAAVGLSLVYGGLLYIGATMSGLGVENLDRVSLLILATDTLLGNFGKYALSIAIALACLTTAIGLTATVGDYFQELSKGKLKSKYVILISTAFSGYLSIKGVDNIVNIAGGVLSILYPVAIVLIFLNLFPNIFTKHSTYIGAVFGAFVPSIIRFFMRFGLEFKMLITIQENHPTLYSFIWVIPAVIFGIIFTFFAKKETESGNFNKKELVH
ncbi:branched-chain amino acid transport system II carrier protein [Peptoniphilus stercorisuis]|uniref:Branched-chain amino acid transport system carrier protein n=1 Tax=Peptoniphilus stercorisuis TaxID=1436965 RepID=A0ABS4KBR4_9FIRM|nr:branched-chain amino acid transport system II carrier protein [Peptoniphilus stercorisuis]MBP2024696.1 LIVCS family branched-chain amino acid:cation transporter [Peptoniphilus stercorisuis]